jgi:hypothetical protein
MRRREKFVVVSVLLSLGLLATQYIPLDWRYLSILVFFVLSYFASAWALSDDLQAHEWLTIVPFPALYASSVALFYFLLPEIFWSRLIVIMIFGVGMYGLFLTSNIFSVAKGRTIQLLYAAHAVALFFTMLTSLLFSNVIFSLRLPFYYSAALLFASHFPLVMMSLWSIELKQKVGMELTFYSLVFSLILTELAVLFSFLPLEIWSQALFIMSFLYVGLSILQNLLKGRLFRNTINEYNLVAFLMLFLFLILFPGK